MSVDVGSKAPDFTLTNEERQPVKLSEQRGKPVVLAFFPAAFSGVCTKELCTFRDSFARLNQAHAQVYGISVDTFFTLKAFQTDQKLPFPLLSDFNKQAIRDYGVFNEDMIGLKGIAKRAVFVIDKDGVVRYRQVLEDARAREIVMGGQAPGSTQFDYPVLANKLFGFKFKVVTGYESTPKIHLAMESGEVHGTIANWSTLKAINTDWIKDKKVRILAQWALQKNAELPDIPLFMDLAKTDSERDALRLMLARLEYGRPFFLPPDVPVARVEALRRAFDATMKDPAYLAEADKLKIDVEPLSGEAVAALVEQVSRTPADTVARVRAALETR